MVNIKSVWSMLIHFLQIKLLVCTLILGLSVTPVLGHRFYYIWIPTVSKPGNIEFVDLDKLPEINSTIDISGKNVLFAGKDKAIKAVDHYVERYNSQECGDLSQRAYFTKLNEDERCNISTAGLDETYSSQYDHYVDFSNISYDFGDILDYKLMNRKLCDNSTCWYQPIVLALVWSYYD